MKYKVEFGADGIRGEVGKWPLIPSGAVQIGSALGYFAHRYSDHPCVVIGRDTRLSGVCLLHGLVAGLTGQGVEVIDLGVMTTPGIAFIARQQQANLGIVISASHNPLQDNGIKIVGANGLRLQREEEIEIQNLISECVTKGIHFVADPGQRSDGSNLIELYINDHVKKCQISSLKGFKVVLDCADGAASRIAPSVFKRLEAEVVTINVDRSGKNINYRRGSEHVRENPQALVKNLQKYDAKYGFAFDGDGDRLVVVDQTDRIFDGIELLFVLAKSFHSEGLLRGKTVVTNHQANRGLEDALGQEGVQIVYTRNGDRNLETAMWSGDYLLGGEPTGNIIINDGHHTAADAVYTALMLSSMLVRHPETTLAEWIMPLKKRPQETISITLPSSLTFEQKLELKTKIQEQEHSLKPGGRILTWDSSTQQGLFRIMVEGGRESGFDEVLKTMKVIQQIISEKTD